MNISIPLEEEHSIKMDFIEFKKIMFVNNALENGWTIKKDGSAYIFSKKHEGKKEIYLDDYLKQFLCENIA